MMCKEVSLFERWQLDPELPARAKARLPMMRYPRGASPQWRFALRNAATALLGYHCEEGPGIPDLLRRTTIGRWQLPLLACIILTTTQWVLPPLMRMLSQRPVEADVER